MDTGSELRGIASLYTPNSQLKWPEYNNVEVSNGLKISKCLLTRLTVRIRCVGRPSCISTSILNTRSRHEMRIPEITQRDRETHACRTNAPWSRGLAPCAVTIVFIVVATSRCGWPFLPSRTAVIYNDYFTSFIQIQLERHLDRSEQY